MIVVNQETRRRRRTTTYHDCPLDYLHTADIPPLPVLGEVSDPGVKLDTGHKADLRVIDTPFISICV
jgi:hypothetical protein